MAAQPIPAPVTLAGILRRLRPGCKCEACRRAGGDVAVSDWRDPYRSRDASGSPEAAENVGWRWIDAIAVEMKLIYGAARLLIESPPLSGEGRVIALYLDTKPIAVATIFRDQMNFAVLIRWRAPPASLPQHGNSRCPGCGKTWAEFRKTTTCGMGGCPWGGDV